MRVALVQVEISPEKDENVARALAYVERAAAEGSDLIALPENFSFFGSPQALREQAETLEGPTLGRMREAAAKHGVFVLAGTVKRRWPHDESLRNSSCLIGPDGEIVAVYDKIHTFNANLPGGRYEAVESGGDQIVIADVRGVPVGLTVCYDIRFPELYRILALRGAKIVFVPSLFTQHTGKDHWEVLLRARAIENQVYVAAPAIHGIYPPDGNRAYGRTMVVDPWGIVSAQASDASGVVVADLDLGLVDQVRKQMFTLGDRRRDAYSWPQEDLDLVPSEGRDGRMRLP